MGRAEDKVTEPAPEDDGEAVYGMGVSSEHDQGEVQEVDSRERE